MIVEEEAEYGLASNGGENTDKPPKKRKKKFEYPGEALAAHDPLNRVIFFGRRFNSDERDALMTANISMTTELVSQIEFKISDPDFRHLDKGIFQLGIPVKYEDLFLDVAAVDTYAEEGTEAIAVRCRPRLVRKLKNRRGTKVMKNASPSDFVRSECEALGINCIVQDSGKRKQIARDVKREKGDTEAPSSWTTFKRLADEIGFSVFESGNTLYFGKQTFFMQRFRDDALVVRWGFGDESTQMLEVPECTRNEDDDNGETTIRFKLQSRYGRRFRPGRVCKVAGVPTFEGNYLIKSVEYSLLYDDYVEVEVGTPTSEKKVKNRKNNDNDRVTSSMRFLMSRVGFKEKNNALDIAIAVAMAESKGDSKKLNKDDTGTTWGPRCGLFQVRALREPNKHDGVNKLRVQKKLLDAEYNAEFVYKITDKGTKWSMFDSYNNGSYKKYFKKEKDYKVKGWSHKLPKPKDKDKDKKKGDKDPNTGRGTASAFVDVAARQAGDSYVYGAEAAVSNPNPSAFDCSELVQWALGRVGVSFVDGSSAQIEKCKPISVQQAINTKGALLWHPGHIAISMGNGRTIEAANPGFGVGFLNAGGRFTRGGLVPGLKY